MRFFYQKVQEINDLDRDVLKGDDEGEKDAGTEGDKGDVESVGGGDEPVSGRRKLYVWIDCVKAVSDLTGFDFGQVFAMGITEFLAYLAYVNFDRRREEMRIRKMRKGHGKS